MSTMSLVVCLTYALAAEPAPLDTQLEALRDGAGQTLPEVEAAAAATSVEGRARDALVVAAEAQYLQTVASFVPRLGVSAQAARLSPVDPQVVGLVVVSPGSAEGPLAPGAGLVNAPFSFRIPEAAVELKATLAVPLSDYLLRLPPALRGLAAQRDAEALEAAAARRRARVGGAELFFAQLRAEVALTVVEQALALARSNLAAARARQQAGSSSRAEVAQLEAAVASTEQQLVATREAGLLLAERLAALLHQPAHRLALKADLVAPLPPLAEPDPEALAHQALASRSEARVLARRADALRAQAEVLRAAAFPRLDALAEAAYANPSQRSFPPPDAYRLTWSVGAQLSWGLTDLLTARETVAGAEANLSAVEAQQAAVADTLRVEAFEASRRVLGVEAVLASSARGLAAAEEAMRTRRRLFEAGAASATELVEAQTALVAAQFSALEARVEQRRARRLRELVAEE